MDTGALVASSHQQRSGFGMSALSGKRNTAGRKCLRAGKYNAAGEMRLRLDQKPRRIGFGKGEKYGDERI